MKRKKQTILSDCLCSHLIDSKSNGVHVPTLAPIFAAVLLHEGDQKTARHLIVLWVVILLQQRDLILRVDPKCVYKDGAVLLACFIVKVASQDLFALFIKRRYHLIMRDIIRVSVTMPLGLTGMVPAASSGAASPPRAVELHGVPVVHAVVAQSIGSQVTDL